MLDAHGVFVMWPSVCRLCSLRFSIVLLLFQHDISIVLSELHRLRGELSSKSLQRARASQLRKLDRVLSAQVAVGGLLRPLLPRFLDQQQRLAEAVDNALHRVTLDGITLAAPVSAANSGVGGRPLQHQPPAYSAARTVAAQTAELESLLHSSSSSLGALGAALTGGSRHGGEGGVLDSFTSLSTSSTSLSHVVESSSAELSDAAGLLARALALERQTRSLRTQHMQRGKIQRMKEEITADPATLRDRSVFRY
jgi:hypothetical protein